MASGVTLQGNIQGVNPLFLSHVVQAVAAVGGTALRITSAVRTAAQNTAAGGVSGSAHLTGHALDGEVFIPGRGWVPLGTALAGVASRFALRSGDQPGFFRGGRDPVHVDDRVATTTSTPGGLNLGPWIWQRAQKFGLDPEAVISVAKVEGGLTTGGPPGDNGTSFGPFQLHQGGALPARFNGNPAAAQAWAWSPAGIDYALQGMASHAAGKRGTDAIQAIVRGFERPAAPAAEVARASQLYQLSHASGNFFSDVGGYVGKAVTGAGVPIPGIGTGLIPGVDIGSATDLLTKGPFSFLNLDHPFYTYVFRGLQIVAGAGLVGMGTLLLVRQVALAADLPDPLTAVGGPTTAALAAKTGGLGGPSGQGGDAPTAIFEQEPGASRRPPPKREDLSPRPRPVYSTRRRSSRSGPTDDIPF